MADYKPKLRNNLQVAQDNLAQPPEGNGWPDALTDSGTQIRQAITNGSNGEVNTVSDNSTSQQRLGAHQTPEGKYAANTPNTDSYYRSEDDMPSLKDPLKTGQQILGQISAPEGK